MAQQLELWARLSACFSKVYIARGQLCSTAEAGAVAKPDSAEGIAMCQTAQYFCGANFLIGWFCDFNVMILTTVL